MISRGLALSLALLFLTSPAVAYHDQERRLIEGTAYTLPKRTILLGPFKLQYAYWKPFFVGTYHPLWLLKVANLHAKWNFYLDDPWAIAARIGFFRVDSRDFGDQDSSDPGAVLNITPAEIFGSYRFNERYSLHSSLAYTHIVLAGEGSLEDDSFHGAGEAALSNLQATSTFEWRLSKATALLLRVRYLVFQDASVKAETEIMPDEFTTIEVEGGLTTDALDFPRLFSIVPGVAWSWKYFNMRLGVGYGNFNVPWVNFMIPIRSVVPELDIYWNW